MKFDINRYKAENDAVRLTEAQKNAIKSNAERSAKARAVRSFPTWAKPIAAALAVMMIGGGIALGQNTHGKNNMFSITANAASTDDEAVELNNEFKPVGELKSFGGGATYIFDAKNDLNGGYLFRYMDFSFDCEGDNVKNITYTANNGAFRIINTDNIYDMTDSDYLKTKDEDRIVSITTDDLENICSSYTVDKGYVNVKNSDDEPNIALVTKIDLVSGDCPKEIRENYNSDFATKSQLQKYHELENETMLKDLSVDITVTYNDGSTETKTMVFDSEFEITDWETEPDGGYCYDSKTTINAKVK